MCFPTLDIQITFLYTIITHILSESRKKKHFLHIDTKINFLASIDYISHETFIFLTDIIDQNHIYYDKFNKYALYATL